MSTLLAIGIFNMSKEEHIWFVYEKIDITHLNGIFFYQKVIAIMLKQTFMLQGVLYLILSFRLIKENKENIQNYYANTTDATLEKANTLNISLIFAIGAGIILSLIGKERFIQHDVALFFPSIVVSIILFTIGFLGNKQQSVLTTEETQENETETKTTEYGNEQLILIREKIQTLFEKEKIYLNKDLTIWELSRTIGTNRTYISNIINNEYNQNFSTFVNSYRVKFAQKLILKNHNMSNQDLAELSGFGSVVSMQRSFQMLEGKTIKQFKEQSPENYEI
jgi:YesN/AraC family two-component response regulator